MQNVVSQHFGISTDRAVMGDVCEYDCDGIELYVLEWLFVLRFGKVRVGADLGDCRW